MYWPSKRTAYITYWMSKRTGHQNVLPTKRTAYKTYCIQNVLHTKPCCTTLAVSSLVTVQNINCAQSSQPGCSGTSPVIAQLLPGCSSVSLVIAQRQEADGGTREQAGGGRLGSHGLFSSSCFQLHLLL